MELSTHPEVRRLDGVARGERPARHRVLDGRTSGARGEIAHALAHVVERLARPLGVLQALPLDGGGASELGQERGGVLLGAGDDLPGPTLGPRELGGGAGEVVGGLALAPLDREEARRLGARLRVEPGEELAEPGRLRRAVGLRPLDERRVEAEAGGDREGVALPRVVVDQTERRGESFAIELDRRVASARVRAGERLQRLEVGRGHHQCPASLEGLEDGLRQRRPFVRIRARAELVQEHEGVVVHVLEHVAHLADEGRERREILGDALLVPDHGDEARDQRQAASLRGRNVAPNLRHQHEEPEGFERDRLAAGVRAGHDEEGPLAAEFEIDRDDGPSRIAPALGQKERVARGAERHHSRVQDGVRRVHPLGEPGARDDPVELAEVRDQALDLGQASPDGLAELGQEPRGLLLLLAGVVDQVVVGLDDAVRFEEHGLAALRAVVDDAAEAGARFGAHGDHVAPVAAGHVAVAEDPVGVGCLEQRVQVSDDAPLEVPDPLPEAAEVGARAVGQGPVVGKRRGERLAEVVELREAVADVGEGGRDRTDALAVRPEPGSGLEEGNEAPKLDAVEDGAVRPAAGEARSHVRDRLPGGETVGGHGEARLTGLVERGRHRGRVEERSRSESTVAPHRRVGLCCEEGPDLGPLDAPARERLRGHVVDSVAPAGHVRSLRGAVRSVAGANPRTARAAWLSSAPPAPSACAGRSAFRSAGAS